MFLVFWWTLAQVPQSQPALPGEPDRSGVIYREVFVNLARSCLPRLATAVRQLLIHAEARKNSLPQSVAGLRFAVSSARTPSWWFGGHRKAGRRASFRSYFGRVAWNHIQSTTGNALDSKPP